MSTEFGEPLAPLHDSREAALARIQQAFVLGELSHEEMDARIQSVLTARSNNDVMAAVGSLPKAADDRQVDIVATSGRIRRDGPWRVPRVLRIQSEFGKVRLDFSRAVFESRVVDVELRLHFGWAKVVVPSNAVVDLDGLQAAWKQPRHAAPSQSTATGPLIRISGRMEFGRLTVRHR